MSKAVVRKCRILEASVDAVNDISLSSVFKNTVEGDCR
jgi:hypothetical protein